MGWGCPPRLRAREASQRSASAHVPASTWSCLGLTCPPKPGTSTPLSWVRQSRGISKPTRHNCPSCAQASSREHKRRSRGSKHRCEADSWSRPTPHSPTRPRASRQPLLYVLTCAMGTMGRGEDYEWEHFTALQNIKHLLTAVTQALTTHVASQGPPPPLPYPEVLLPSVQPLPPGLRGTLTVSLNPQAPQAQAHPPHGQQRACSGHCWVCPRTPRAPEQIQSPSRADELLLHTQLLLGVNVHPLSNTVTPAWFITRTHRCCCHILLEPPPPPPAFLSSQQVAGRGPWGHRSQDTGTQRPRLPVVPHLC